MPNYKVHVFIVAREIVFDVEADTRGEALNQAHKLADDSLFSKFNDPSVKTVAISYDIEE